MTEHKEPVSVVCGYGKPSSEWIKRALETYIARGTTLIHDRERSQGALVRENGLEDENYKATCADPHISRS